MTGCMQRPQPNWEARRNVGPCSIGRDMIQSVAGLAGNRFNADQVTALTDAWLTTADVVRLEPVRTRDAIRRRDGTLVAT